MAPGVRDGLGRSEAKAGNERARARVIATIDRVKFIKRLLLTSYIPLALD